MKEDYSVQDFQNLKAKIAKLEKDLSRSEGMLEILTKRLKEDFECRSLEEAQKMLLRWRREQENSLKKLQEDMREWHEKWGGKLEECDA